MRTKEALREAEQRYRQAHRFHHDAKSQARLQSLHPHIGWREIAARNGYAPQETPSDDECGRRAHQAHITALFIEQLASRPDGTSDLYTLYSAPEPVAPTEPETDGLHIFGRPPGLDSPTQTQQLLRDLLNRR